MANKQDVFEQLYADYFAMVYQMSKGFVRGEQSLAKDLTQEVFFNIWRSLDRFRGTAEYKTWIYRITVNTCLRYLSNSRNLRTVDLSDVAVSNHTTDKDQPADPAYQSLYDAIGQLNEVDRLIIMMVLDELQYPEIAEVMGISEGNLRVKIHRIKKRLKKRLDHERHIG